MQAEPGGASSIVNAPPEGNSPPSVSFILEPIGGAVPLDSHYYIVRPTDADFENAVGRGDSIVLVKGARQMGKTSLLARGLQQARGAGTRVVLTDLQKLTAEQLESAEALFLTLAESIAEQLDLDVSVDALWDSGEAGTSTSSGSCDGGAEESQAPLVWGLDEVDRLFTCPSSEVFGLFRSWHNERALDPDGPWGGSPWPSPTPPRRTCSSPT